MFLNVTCKIGWTNEYFPSYHWVTLIPLTACEFCRFFSTLGLPPRHSSVFSELHWTEKPKIDNFTAKKKSTFLWEIRQSFRWWWKYIFLRLLNRCCKIWRIFQYLTGLALYFIRCIKYFQYEGDSCFRLQKVLDELMKICILVRFNIYSSIAKKVLIQTEQVQYDNYFTFSIELFKIKLLLMIRLKSSKHLIKVKVCM